ncbi:acyltransferase [Escherichia coli]|jgi:peptidoglycan/LPS O-acetylase OafA/YrhL|uniref:acyltransferase family protein n=1 Tax=Enterobacteriaceae TaxID=543 RepID=UPI00075153A7|nr:acyltransferase [Escherichia coli]EGK2830424.1 acyltransferase [Escherichia coli]EHH6299349.1 acyltransferase [Escherichia coli]EHO4048099.1 acyltransferase [Escherichia coli]EIJ1649177.1 acyltransferase [Escherichia coli]EIX8558536.1 acyltransferase [Escherichia coli]
MKTTVRIEALDGLRFMAFMMVMLYHYLFAGPISGFLPKELTVNAFYFGDFGVDLFFIISGFVISLSSVGRTPVEFIKSRINRIVPTFIIFGFIVLVFQCFIPMVDFKERIVSLFYSFTFFPQVFGYHFFSDIYWTIQKEVTFYILVFIMMLFNIWSGYRREICFAWLVISYSNQFLIHSSFVDALFITEHAGHFIAGIVIYDIMKNKPSPFDFVLMVLSVILIYNRMLGFNSYVNGSFGYSVSDASLLLACISLVTLTWCASNVSEVGKFYNVVKFLGAMTYPLYLIHADIGFWSHAMFERKWWVEYPVTKTFVNYEVTIVISMLISFTIAALYIKLLDKKVTRAFNKIWGLFGLLSHKKIKGLNTP